MADYIERYVSGPQNLATQSSIYPSRGATSHHWRGPGFFMPSRGRFTRPHEVWDPIQQRLDINAIRSHGPANEGRYPHSHDPCNQKWPGRPVFHSVNLAKWMNEYPCTAVPRDARLFYNEEDWIKWKSMVGHPSLPALRCAAQRLTTSATNDERPRGKRQIKCPRDHDFYF